ncbi:nucleotidyltransferase family protein [candidate division KSB1 bacterium]|nr:nucleotidyltransferase family protein [candidate division KSB1 bacterium]MBL7092900.1 nucleotidyltransferase family protein [candidate division KSB1 bacterium]
MAQKSIKSIEKKLTKYKPELESKYKIKALSLFGSYVREEQNRKSDIDILVEFHEIPSLLNFIEIENSLSDLLGIKVDLVRRQAIRKELKEIILNEAVTIW